MRPEHTQKVVASRPRESRYLAAPRLNRETYAEQ